ncbi:MAG: Glycosyl transferase family 39, partial [Candidatus Amesbacteria bacterium GW2011_GWA2_47_70]
MRRLLILALIIGSLTRLLWISRYPAGFTADEAAFGYNAYSLLLTGRDEWGTPWWQLFFTNLRSFGDYKLPLYAFLAVPSVKIFGLTEFAVRLPNAIFG